MSYRHLHVTSFLYEDAADVARFRGAAEKHFRYVWPLLGAEDRVIGLAFYSKDLDSISDELEMPDVTEALSGILEHDAEIVSAWEPPHGFEGHECERVWRVPGRKSLTT